jgi:hypothetical protein
MKKLLGEIRELILSARKAVVHSVDLIQVVTNFEIGRRIIVHEQQGAERAEYGKALLKALAEQLTNEFGRGFSRSNLEYMRKFFLTYRERLPEKSQMASGKLPTRQKSQTASDELPSADKTQTLSGQLIMPVKSQTPSAQFTLSWSHYVFLISIASFLFPPLKVRGGEGAL